MATEIGPLYAQVKGSLDATLMKWQWDLQSKWGDPRVYQLQKESMLKHEERLAYDLSRRREHRADSSYDTQRQKNRDAHKKRMSTLAASTRPQSRVPPAPKTRKASAASSAHLPHATQHPSPAGPSH